MSDKPSVDPKCIDLALHFLGEASRHDMEWELANAIQQAVEDWFAMMEIEAGEPTYFGIAAGQMLETANRTTIRSKP